MNLDGGRERSSHEKKKKEKEDKNEIGKSIPFSRQHLH
jgi:hypothetical protein